MGKNLKGPKCLFALFRGTYTMNTPTGYLYNLFLQNSGEIYLAGIPTESIPMPHPGVDFS